VAVARIVLDPDEVNQDRVVTLTDGTVVELSDASRTTLERIARQLHVHRSSYAHALDDPHLGDRVAAGEARLEDHAPLYLRVGALLEKARQGRRRPAAELDLELLLQTRVWTSSSGTTTVLVGMTPSHRRNLVNWLERHSEALRERADGALSPTQRERIVAADPWVAGTPLYRRLVELIAAETGLDHAKDRARQIAREIEFERSGRWPEE
jgi:hypothetical protein